MRFYKVVGCLVVSVISAVLLGVSSFAIGSNIDEYSEEYDFESFLSVLDDETLAILQEIGIDELSLDDMFSVEPSKVFDSLFNMVGRTLKEPLRFLAISTGVLIISTLMGSLTDSPVTLDIIGSGVLCLSLAVPVAGVVTASFSVLETVNLFTTAFAGVFCALVSSAGKVSTGITYASLTVFSDTLFSSFLSGVSQPVVNAMCGLGFISCFDVGGFTPKLSQGIKKVYVYVLSFIGTVFSGIVTLKGVLSDGVDTLTSRSVRFVVGRSLPVVGGTVSETYSTLISSLSLIKNTVGVFGILTVVVIVLPVLIQLLVWVLVTEVTASVAEALGTDGAVCMLRVLKDALILLVATISIVATVFVVSIGVVITVKGGGV